MKKRKICVVTGTRAEYGLLYPVMKAIKSNPKLKLQVFVTGMHLEKKFGYSADEIKKDGFKVDAEVKLNPKSDRGGDVVRAIGKAVVGIAGKLEILKPDFLLVLGDRFESLAATIAAAYMNIPIAHIHGGDSPKAGIDEPVRHSITKFASIHFPATRKSAERILKMGEDKWRIFISGAPGLDTILHKRIPTKKEIEKVIKIKLPKKYILLIQHSVSTEPQKAKSQIIETIEVIKKLRMPVIAIYPNSDAGGRAIIKELKKIKSLDYVHLFKNLSHSTYLGLMKNCSLMLGNSSSGIIESSSFKIPVVNIGIRQEGRERAGNVINVPHEKDKIKKAVLLALSKKFKNKIQKIRNPYGDGKVGQRIAEVLAKIKINKGLIQKKLTY